MPKLTDDQRLAVESIDEHVLVSAGAGCGKTLVLVERYLEVLRKNPDATVSDIIAVTFTRKAAEEMRSRLKARLREMVTEHPEEKQRWSRLLFDVDRARIGTIHSLCESILKANPAEAGVDPQFEVLDDLMRAELREEAVDAALRELIDTDSSPLLLEYPIDRIKEWAMNQLGAVPQYKEARSVLGGEQMENLRPLALKVLAQVRDSLLIDLAESQELQQVQSYLEANPFGDPQNTVEITRTAIVTCLNRFRLSAEKADADAMASAIKDLSDIPSPGGNGGAKAKPLRDVIKRARELAAGFAEDCPLELTEDDEQAFEMLKSFLHLVDRALVHFESAKRHAQRLDYNDLITKTHALVTAPNSLTRKQISNGIRAVLVDEFQDTNRTQAELLSALCGNSSRIFLIGDDKQSIYKFQGADVSTFNEWKTRIHSQTHGLDGRAQLHALSFSFRSHPTIVNFVNSFFQLHFATNLSASSSHRASYQALTPARIDTHAHEHVEVVVYDSTPGENDKRDGERARALESRAIAAWILEKVTSEATVFCTKTNGPRPIEFGDFAILVQTNGDFGSIESALAEVDIPYVTFAGAGFLDRQEILDIENLLRWLANPLDDHALFAVLRAPFFSVNDAVIHKMVEDEAGSFWQRLQSAAKKEDFEILRRPVAILKQLVQDSKSAQLADLVRTVITVTSFDVNLLAMPNGRQKSRNAWKMASFASQHNHLTLTEFVKAMESMRELGAGKQTDAPLSAENAVKLMTIHKSKGLEFPAVILPVLGRKIHSFSPKLLVHRDFGIALDTSRSKDDPKPSYFRAASVLNQEMEAQEKKRLLYVAMTRARDWLCMFVEQSARSEVSFRLWLRDALGLDPAQDEDGSSAGKGALRQGEQYTTRYVDEDAVSDWLSHGTALGGKVITSEDLEALSQEIGFDLIAPFDTTQPEQTTVPWTAIQRVTAGEDAEPHATTVGNLFHAAMQRLVIRGKADDADGLSLLAAQDLFIADGAMRLKLVSECQRLLEIYGNSTLCEMLVTARRFLPEVGYTTIDGDGGSAEKRPDLIFQDSSEQWHIVDFKTDKLDDTNVAAKLNEHSAQVIEYMHDFAKLTGNSARGWLYFAELGALEEVKAAGFNVGNKGQLRLPFAFK